VLNDRTKPLLPPIPALTAMSAPADTEYHIIFAGGTQVWFLFISLLLIAFTGGTAGCLIACRLSMADPSLKILVLEAGLHTKNLDAHTQPARYLSHLAPTSKTVTFNVGNAAKEIGGRQLITPSGRCVGGGSSVNCESQNYLLTVSLCTDFLESHNVQPSHGQ